MFIFIYLYLQYLFLPLFPFIYMSYVHFNIYILGFSIYCPSCTRKCGNGIRTHQQMVIEAVIRSEVMMFKMCGAECAARAADLATSLCAFPRGGFVGLGVIRWVINEASLASFPEWPPTALHFRGERKSQRQRFYGDGPLRARLHSAPPSRRPAAGICLFHQRGRCIGSASSATLKFCTATLWLHWVCGIWTCSGYYRYYNQNNLYFIYIIIICIILINFQEMLFPPTEGCTESCSLLLLVELQTVYFILGQ